MKKSVYIKGAGTLKGDKKITFKIVPRIKLW